ncbi:MAG: SDR family NAD(P)-dependent oxidoreductase [bacterium]|nr:SDR family NAD(P)-dependent oxidoreductase [bacterium]
MQSFRGKIAVVTGGGTGMGRELAKQLAADGCHVAICDVSTDNMAETKAQAEALAIAGARITTHVCDVSDEPQVLAFRDAVLSAHGTSHLNLLFNNAGIAGGGSFVRDDRAEWERTFAVCWYGVYYCTRAFLPLLIASDEGYVINTSSVNGFWASLGPAVSHTAYSTAKFAVKGFTEALITDLRLNAPHVKAALVMPGHVGTSIVFNTGAVHGTTDAETAARMREMLSRRGLPADQLTDEQLVAAMQQMATAFRDLAPTSAGQAATTILDGVRTDRWRILVGEDARVLDRMVREQPELAYEAPFAQALNDQGHMRLLE